MRKEKRYVVLDEDNVLMAVDVFLDVGKQAHRLSKYKRAMGYFDTAVELDPESLKPLEPRAATLVKLAHFTEALEELAKLEAAHPAGAQAAVPLSARRLRVEALWQGGRFEEAAVLAARGMRVRRQPPYFADLFYTSLGTLEQCVGRQVLGCLEALDGGLLERLRPDPGPEAGDEVGDEIGPVRKRHFVKPLTKEELCRDQRVREFQRTQRIYRARLFLGALGNDLEFIDNLAEHPALPSANSASGASVRRHVDVVSGDITKRMGHMQEECPLYVIRHRANKYITPEQRRRMERQHRARAERAQEEATTAILRLLAARESGDVRRLRQATVSARNMFEAVSRSLLPDKGDYQALLYHLVGATYMQLGLMLHVGPDVRPEARARLLRQKVRSVLQTGEGENDAAAGVVARVAMPFFDYERSLRNDERRLKRAKSRLERLCLTFEMAHCCCKMKRWWQGLNLAKKALAMAKEGGHNIWMVLSAVERCKAELHLNTRIEAKTSIREAIEMAEVLDDESVLEVLHAIAKALDRPEDALLLGDVGEEPDPQQRILRLMANDALRGRCAEMFARVNTLPPECRMPLCGRWKDDAEAEAAGEGRRRAAAATTFFRDGDA